VTNECACQFSKHSAMTYTQVAISLVVVSVLGTIIFALLQKHFGGADSSKNVTGSKVALIGIIVSTLLTAGGEIFKDINEDAHSLAQAQQHRRDSTEIANINDSTKRVLEREEETNVRMNGMLQSLAQADSNLRRVVRKLSPLTPFAISVTISFPRDDEWLREHYTNALFSRLKTLDGSVPNKYGINSLFRRSDSVVSCEVEASSPLFFTNLVTIDDEGLPKQPVIIITKSVPTKQDFEEGTSVDLMAMNDLAKASHANDMIAMLCARRQESVTDTSIEVTFVVGDISGTTPNGRIVTYDDLRGAYISVFLPFDCKSVVKHISLNSGTTLLRESTFDFDKSFIIKDLSMGTAIAHRITKKELGIN